jgi:arylsulfatase A-like enzyme
MGYQTPNIDRLAKEGVMFTDSYGEQSCTAGRSSFITDHDKNVGEMLDYLDELGIAENTFVMYSTDNQPALSAFLA